MRAEVRHIVVQLRDVSRQRQRLLCRNDAIMRKAPIHGGEYNVMMTIVTFSMIIMVSMTITSVTISISLCRTRS